MPVTFKSFRNKGSGHLRQALGNVVAATCYTTAMEIAFRIPADIQKKYEDLTARQWAGPDVIWKKTGDPLASSWIIVGRSTSGANHDDDPESESIFSTTDGMGYFDSPGPDVSKYIGQQISRLHVIQLFTGWIQGTPVSGGDPKRLCPVVSWYSRVSIGNYNWQDREAIADWDFFAPSGSGLGWLDLKNPPAV
jgi:hypothetical protein